MILCQWSFILCRPLCPLLSHSIRSDFLADFTFRSILLLKTRLIIWRRPSVHRFVIPPYRLLRRDPRCRGLRLFHLDHWGLPLFISVTRNGMLLIYIIVGASLLRRVSWPITTLPIHWKVSILGIQGGFATNLIEVAPDRSHQRRCLLDTGLQLAWFLHLRFVHNIGFNFLLLFFLPEAD